MAKIANDKYYTPRNAVLKVIEVIEKDIMPINDFQRIIEPSAGNGAFLKELPAHAIGYDILPEYEGIIKGDYLEQELEHKENSLVIGNPPFGRSGDLVKKFIKKSLEHSEYVAFIIPADNYKKNPSIEGVVLHKTYLLPKLKYSGVPLDCCFNIYKKGIRKKKELIDDVLIYEWARDKNTTKEDEKRYLDLKCDLRFISFGTIRIIDNNESKTRVREIKIKLPFNVLRFEEKLQFFLEIKSKRCISSSFISATELKEFIWDYFPALRK